MKLLLLCLLIIITGNVFGQTDTIKLKKTKIEQSRKVVTDRAPQALYFGLGGSGLIFSGNYDRRFAKKLNGPGFTAGVGLFFGGNLVVVSLPVSLNYLFGKRDNFLEVAAGTTLVTGFVDWGGLFNGSSVGFIEHINLGYRYQPAKGGFFFRGGFCPLITGGGSVMSYYLGGGVSF